MKLVRTTLSAALLVGLATAPGHGQQPDFVLDTLAVEAVSRTPSGVASSARAFQVLTAGQIRALPVRSVSEALSHAFGVDLMPRSTAQADVGIRGSTFEQVVVLVDGVRMSDPQTGHFHLNLALPLEQVERIEILRGPASAVHGANAVGGVINIVTRDGGPGLSGRAETGSFGTVGLGASVLTRIVGVRVDAGGDLHRTDGHREGVDAEVLQGRLGLRAPLGRQTLRADLGMAARDFGADGFYGDFPSYEETRTATGSLALDATLGPIRIAPRLSFRRHDDDFILLRDDPSFYRNLHTSRQTGAEVVIRSTGAGAVGATIGAEAFRDALESTNLGDPVERRAALFGELAAGRTGSATGSVGLRGDWHEAYGTFWTPSLAAAWWPSPGIRLRGSAGRAFRAPTWTERFYEDPANLGDPDLSPERSRTVEGGADLQLGRGVTGAIGGFVRTSTDLIDWARSADAPDDRWRTRNVGRATFRGIETELGIARLLGLGWRLQGAWTSLEADQEEGFTSQYALRPLTETLAAEVNRTMGDRWEVTGRASRFRRRGEDAHATGDLRLAYRADAARLYLDVRNLSGTVYPDITGRPAAGRSLTLGLSWPAAR